jgi:hypothetical protein
MYRTVLSIQRMFTEMVQYLTELRERVLIRIPLTRNRIHTKKTYGSASGEAQKRCGRFQIYPRLDRCRSADIPGSPGGSRSGTLG